jgi:hypothetical protein
MLVAALVVQLIARLEEKTQEFLLTPSVDHLLSAELASLALLTAYAGPPRRRFCA